MDYTMKKLAAAMLVAGLSVAATAQAQTAEDVKVGFAGPMTGAQAHYGKDFQNGVVLAAKKYRLLGYAYRIFLVGMTASLIAFVPVSHPSSTTSRGSAPGALTWRRGGRGTAARA